MRYLAVSTLTICSLLMTSLASAELSFGIGVGHASSEKIENSDISAMLLGNRIYVAENFTQDTSDIAFRLFSAYEFTDWLDAEIAFTDYGENSFYGEINQMPTPTTSDFRSIDVSGKLSGFSISIAPKKKYANGVTVNAKMGALLWNINGDGTEYFVRDGTEFYSNKLKVDDDGVDFLFGMGISYSYFTLSYERTSINSSETDLIMLSAKF